MIAYLIGEITACLETSVLLEVQGIGYEIFCPNGYFEEETNKSIKIYIYEHIKEDAHDLYGFQTMNQKMLFKKLISVSGIGPKVALQILNTYTAEETIEIILSQDIKALSKVSGIGPKTAQRLVLELKDSLSKWQIDSVIPLLQTPTAEKTYMEDAIEALEVLGYPLSQAKQVVKAVATHTDTVEEIIKKALSLLAQ